MKGAFYLILSLLTLPAVYAQHVGIYQRGTIVRMRMGECLPAPHNFMANFGSPVTQNVTEACPEFTLVSDKVVFVIVGRSSNQLLPLADVIDFRLQNHEVAVRLDDAKHEKKFSVKEMVLRSEWDRMQRHIDEQLRSADLEQAGR